MVDLLLAITTTNTNYNKKISNLAKIYINGAKYNNQNDISMFKLENL